MLLHILLPDIVAYLKLTFVLGISMKDSENATQQSIRGVASRAMFTKGVRNGG